MPSGTSWLWRMAQRRDLDGRVFVRQKHAVLSRWLAAAVMGLVGVVLIMATTRTFGWPWGMRGHRFAVVAAAGTVEAVASEARRQRERRSDDAIALEPHAWLDEGDVVRVGRLGQVALAMEHGTITLTDGTTARIIATGIQLSKGGMAVEADTAIEVVIEELAATVRMEQGRLRVVFDGKSSATVAVSQGSAALRLGKNGNARALAAGEQAVVGIDVEPAISGRLAQWGVEGRCGGGRAELTAPEGTQLQLLGALHYVEPNAGLGGRLGPIAITGTPSTISVFARGPWGDTKQAVLTCEEPRPGRRGGP